VNPSVSIIVPCYNEERTIGNLLDAILRQSFPHNDVEVIIADGLSTDRTREVIEDFSNTHPSLKIRVVDNIKRIIPAAINTALNHAQGDVIIRLDAHSIPHTDYIDRCLEVLRDTGAANVGGIWEIKPESERWIAHAIAKAASNPLGAGDARYRFGGPAGEVETVPFGAFKKEWVERVGQFDETLLTNEDYEYNYRIRRSGGMIWFDPSIRSVYFARGTLGSLAKQYFRYGYWKAIMLSRNPTSLRWRQALPVLFVLGILILGILAIWFSLARFLFASYLSMYVMVTLIVGTIEAIRDKDPGLVIGFPLALWTMHLSWGIAFLWAVMTKWIWRRSGTRRKS
jgi:succinoglycan biosynthesis protein ExoA